jgi:hypothetical protein
LFPLGAKRGRGVGVRVVRGNGRIVGNDVRFKGNGDNEVRLDASGAEVRFDAIGGNDVKLDSGNKV